MAKTAVSKIDERKILEWAGFKAIDNGDFGIDYIAPDGDYFSILKFNLDIFSLDFQEKYLWGKMRRLKLYRWGKWYCEFDNGHDKIIRATAHNLPEAVLLAIMDLLNEKDG